MPNPDLNTAALSELLAFQDEISRVLAKRFQKQRALVFTDVVGSTAYFEKNGDAAGRALIRRHHSLLEAAMEGSGGRVVDTAGDGAFCVFPDVDAAAHCLCDFQRSIAESNEALLVDSRLGVRTGIHHGTVLIDGDAVSGDAVNFAARICDAGTAEDIYISLAATKEMQVGLRVRCVRLGDVPLKGIRDPAQAFSLLWLDPGLFPDEVRIAETGQLVPLNMLKRVRFGRLATFQGERANEVVLRHPDPDRSRFISRWHFELVRGLTGYTLNQLSRTPIHVDGALTQQGDSRPITPKTVVKISDVLTLHFGRASRTRDVETQGPWSGQ